jgi:hypothetical protein
MLTRDLHELHPRGAYLDAVVGYAAAHAEAE